MGVPVFLLDSLHQRFVFQVLVFRQPLLELNKFQRVSGRNENLRQQRIRIKRDRCHQRIQLVIWNLRDCLLLERILLGRRLSIRRHIAGQQEQRTNERHYAANAPKRRPCPKYYHFHHLATFLASFI
jgi:hypothetical protein